MGYLSPVRMLNNMSMILGACLVGHPSEDRSTVQTSHRIGRGHVLPAASAAGHRGCPDDATLERQAGYSAIKIFDHVHEI